MTIVIAVLRSNLEIIIKWKEYIVSVFEALVYIFRDIRILEHIQSHGLLTGNTKNIEIRLVDIYQHSILIIKFGAPRHLVENDLELRLAFHDLHSRMLY